MLKTSLIILMLLSACTGVNIPRDYTYTEISTRTFKLASWQKITDTSAPYKIYIEGDGHAFNSRGLPTANPTPRSTLVRDLAFGDTSPNVIYLARPCQYIHSDICRTRHWTTARFAPEVVNSEYEAVRQIAGNSPVILVGFSGGAQVAGLLATAKSGLNIKKVITIAGNLDHLSWTEYLQVPPLTESMNLESYRQQFARIPQLHYVGRQDKIMPSFLINNFVQDHNLVIEVPQASHNQGWDTVFPAIWHEN